MVNWKRNRIILSSASFLTTIHQVGVAQLLKRWQSEGLQRAPILTGISMLFLLATPGKCRIRTLKIHPVRFPFNILSPILSQLEEQLPKYHKLKFTKNNTYNIPYHHPLN